MKTSIFCKILSANRSDISREEKKKVHGCALFCDGNDNIVPSSKGNPFFLKGGHSIKAYCLTC